ncbi:ABC transporter, substrate-binding protein, family 3 [Streptococcus sp. oral taxon 058 str. F0407]|nr:ABC transporter, substrate-binding protein, family 3 [Streptococcus sp. oral taxon 058 str. F0407]
MKGFELFWNSNSINKLIMCKKTSYNRLFLCKYEIKCSFPLTNNAKKCIIYTIQEYKHKRRFSMNKVKKVLIAMFGLLMFPLLFACSNNQSQGVEAIKAKGKLVVALNPEFAPFEYQKLVDGKNQIVGSDVELAKAIAKELGVEVEFSPMSFDNVLASLDSGKADLAISGVSKTEERSQVYDFSIPYYTSKNKVIVRKSELTNYQSVKDLAQKKVGAQKGSIQETLVKETLQNSSLVSLPKNGNLITDLKSGQLDVLIFEEPVAKGFVENNPDLAIAEFDVDNDKEDSYAVAMKKDSKELKDAVDKTIQKLKDSGELDKLIDDAFKASIEK